MWINANTLLTRYNMPKTLVVADLVEPDETPMMMDRRDMERATREAYRKELDSILSQESPKRRRAFQQKMRNASTQEERRDMIEGALFESSASGHWDLRGIYAELEFSTALECADALSRRYLSRSLSNRQRRHLAGALGGDGRPDAPLSAEDLTRGQMSDTLHLFFSLAEYQLC